MIKIGIVLATYNGEKYLSQMLDSLLAQTRPADFIVAIDDGSKDDTPNILKGYEGRLPLQVTCLPHNTGHRAAFSKALELAAQQLGEDDLIALADQDDVWLPKKLQILEDTIQKNPEVNLVFGDAQVIDGEGKLLGESWRKMDGVPEHLSLRAILTGFTNVTGCMTLFKAKLLKLVLPIPELAPVHDQWITFCASLEAHDNGVKSISDAVIQYRIHGQNAIGLGDTHTWTGNLKLNLQWAKMVLQTPHFKMLSASDQKFLKRYISYTEDRLHKPFIPQYFFWVIANVASLYPYVKSFTGFLPRILHGIIGAPLIIKFFGKK